ncbi:MAG: hypothetical protein ABEL76_00585, partial [Bradymonadaceae bacterium]
MAVLAVACTTALGCAGGSKQRREPSAGETHLKVDNFIIKGTEAFTPSEIKYGLETQEWSKLRESFGWLPLIEREQPTFNYLAWKNDLDRIRTF